MQHVGKYKMWSPELICTMNAAPVCARASSLVVHSFQNQRSRSGRSFVGLSLLKDAFVPDTWKCSNTRQKDCSWMLRHNHGKPWLGFHNWAGTLLTLLNKYMHISASFYADNYKYINRSQFKYKQNAFLNVLQCPPVVTKRTCNRPYICELCLWIV